MSQGIYRAYLQNLKKHWLSYLAGILALLLTSLTEVLMPKFIQWTVDLLTWHQAAKIPSWFKADSLEATLNTLIVFFIISLLVGWVGRVAWRQLLARRTHEAGHQLKIRFWNVVKDQPLTFLHRYPLGDLMNRATGDWNKSRFIHGFTMVLTFDLIFFTVLALISMFMIDVQLTLACLFLIPFLPRPLIRLSRDEYKQHQTAQEHLSSLSDAISQAVNTVRLQRATNSEGIWEKQLASRAARYAHEQYLVLKISWKIFIVGALPTLGAYLILFTFGVYKINQGAISIGEFIALQSYVLLLQAPLFELGSMISEWQTGFASFSRLLEIFGYETKPFRTRKQLMEPPTRAEPNAIVIQDLSYSYDGEKNVLENINMTIQAGEKVGLTGKIGAGKTSLVEVLTGLNEHYQGEVQLFGTNLAEFGRDWLTRNITVVPQKPFLFAGTIRSNLALDQDISTADMTQALQTVRLWEDVEAMPQGLDTWIGEWGINLSGGQKQRLAIARALLRPTSILILDDCLSAVDSVTEEHILAKLDELFRSQTLLWTAHRASTLQLCDRIFHLDEGRLTELPVERSLKKAAGRSDSNLSSAGEIFLN